MWKKDTFKKNFLRVKQIADQNLGRAEKSEVLSEDLQSVEKRVDVVRQAYTSTTKKIAATLQSTGPDAEKRLKKLPEMGIAHSMLENAQLLGTDSVMGSLFQLCGESESTLAKELVQYEVEVERDVLGPLTNVLEVDIPQIMKLKKQLSRVTLDMDSARSRWTAAVRQAQVHGTNMAQAAAKADQIKDEMEDASNRVEMGKDALASEMFNFVAKEAEYSQKLVEFVAAQSRYHERALETLNEILPKMRTCLDANPNKPVYGQLLSEHLQVTERDIALPIEACVCTLLEVGLDEEGLFRIGGMASRVKKLKSAFDAGIVDMEEYQIDVHAIAGCLKLYLRELPEPLLTFELYQEFMNAVSLPADQRLQALWVTVRKLPQDNYVNLRYLCKFLARLAEKSDVNKMTPSNIAIVIGPNLLWAQDEASPNMLSTGHLSTLAEAFVMHVDYFFPEDVDYYKTVRGSAPPSPLEPSRLMKKSQSWQPANSSNQKTDNVAHHHRNLEFGQSSGDMKRAGGGSTNKVDMPIVPIVTVDNQGSNLVDSHDESGSHQQAAQNSNNSNSASGKELHLTNTYDIPPLRTGANNNLSTSTSASHSHSAPPPVPFLPPTKAFHSDVYSTAFALHSLGQYKTSKNYMTKVRAMWDGQFRGSTLSVAASKHAANGSDKTISTDESVKGTGDGGDGDGAPTTRTTSGHGSNPADVIRQLDVSGSLNATEDVDFAVSTGESSPHSLRQPTHSPVPSRSETVVINNNSTPQPVSQQHSSSSLSSSSSQPSPPVTTKGDHTPPTTHQSSTAPLATAERTVSPKVARRAGKKAAPPPPPDRPHSVAIPPAVSSEKPHSVPRHISPPADVILEDEKSKSLPPPRPHGPPPDRPPSYTGEKPERPKLPPPPAEKPGGHQRSLSTGSTTTRVIVPAPGPQSAGLSGLYPNLDLELGEKDKDSAAAVSLVTQKPPCSGQDNVPNRLVTGMSTFNSGSSCNNEVMASSGSGHTILTNAVTTNSNVLSPGPPIPPVRHGSTRLTRPTPPPPPPPVSHADEETRL